MRSFLLPVLALAASACALPEDTGMEVSVEYAGETLSWSCGPGEYSGLISSGEDYGATASCASDDGTLTLLWTDTSFDVQAFVSETEDTPSYDLTYALAPNGEMTKSNGINWTEGNTDYSDANMRVVASWSVVLRD